MRRPPRIGWGELVPTLLLVNIAVVAPLNYRHSPQVDGLEQLRPRLPAVCLLVATDDGLTVTPPAACSTTLPDGKFRLCSSPEQVQLVCSVSYGDAP